MRLQFDFRTLIFVPLFLSFSACNALAPQAGDGDPATVPVTSVVTIPVKPDTVPTPVPTAPVRVPTDVPLTHGLTIRGVDFYGKVIAIHRLLQKSGGVWTTNLPVTIPNEGGEDLTTFALDSELNLRSLATLESGTTPVNLDSAPASGENTVQVRGLGAALNRVSTGQLKLHEAVPVDGQAAETIVVNFRRGPVAPLREALPTSSVADAFQSATIQGQPARLVYAYRLTNNLGVPFVETSVSNVHGVLSQHTMVSGPRETSCSTYSIAQVSVVDVFANQFWVRKLGEPAFDGNGPLAEFALAPGESVEYGIYTADPRVSGFLDNGTPANGVQKLYAANGCVPCAYGNGCVNGTYTNRTIFDFPFVRDPVMLDLTGDSSILSIRYTDLPADEESRRIVNPLVVPAVAVKSRRDP